MMLTSSFRYEGSFRLGKIQDENATLYYPDGLCEFQGSIKLGKKDGMGTHYHTDGALKKSGVFRDGKLIRDLTHKVSFLENKLAKKSMPTKKTTFSRVAKFPSINFNIDMAYIEKVVAGKINSYYRDFEKEGPIENFIQFHKKNERVQVFDKISQALRFEGIIFVSAKQGICSFYNLQGRLVRRDPHLNGNKVRGGLRFCSNGKIKYRGNWSNTLQEENGFCMQYHRNGAISRIGIKTFGNFTNTFSEFYSNGAIKCLRHQTPDLNVRSSNDRYEKEGVLFYQDGSIRYRGSSEVWGWDFEDSE
jgi:antitoxin component YwqK of YwqJK toxin-antitoxin module